MHEYGGDIDYRLTSEAYSPEECQHIALQLGALATRYQDLVDVSMTVNSHESGIAGVDDVGFMAGRVMIDTEGVPARCMSDVDIDLYHLQYQFESSLSPDVARKLRADIAGVGITLERTILGPDPEVHRHLFAPDDEVAFEAWMSSYSQD